MNISQTSVSTLGATQIVYITAVANDLRQQYITIGASSTQLPRNPVPIHQLIMRVVPNIRGKAISRSEIFKTLEKQGWTKNFTRHSFHNAIDKLIVAGKLKAAKKTKTQWVGGKNDGFRRIKAKTYFASL